jgi:hypothetical protein
MANTTNNIAVDGLDFYEIKARLREFLGSQDKFKDYNFEGSGLSILLDLLAYNTHYINYYSNMVANEMFLDTATVRDSVVSHAKLLGYTPNSITGARAKVSLEISVNPDTGTIEDEFLPKYTTFIARPVDGVSLTFVSLETHKFEPYRYAADGTIQSYWIPEIEIVEGKYRTATFVVDRVNRPAQKFLIPQENVDISTLRVRVQTSTTNINGYDEYWTLVTDPLQLNTESKVYFVQEAENQKYEVYFGDDIVGKNVQNGNVVILEYVVPSADPTVANQVGANETANSLTFSVMSVSGSAKTVRVLTPASGGAGRESVDSIKFYAPRGYQAQDRAVTVEDYSFMLAREYPFAESIYVWGGEDNDPPVYGKVFVSIKPLRGTNLTNQEKEAIKSGVFKRFNVVGITPEIVDPDYTFLRFDSTLKVNPSKSTKTVNEIKQLVKRSINNYINENLGKFGGNLLTSRLYATIDATCTSIEASGTSVTLEKRIEPIYGVSSNYTTNFSNPLQPSTFVSNAFNHFDPAKVGTSSPYSVSYLKDNGQGVLEVVSFEPVTTGSQGSQVTEGTVTQPQVVNPQTLAEKTYRITKPNAGTVNYTTGKIDLPGLNVQSMSGIAPVLRLNSEPSNFAEIETARNQLLIVDAEDPSAINVNVRLSTQGRLNSPTAVRNQPRFAPQSTAFTQAQQTQATSPQQPPSNRTCGGDDLTAGDSLSTC